MWHFTVFLPEGTAHCQPKTKLRDHGQNLVDHNIWIKVCVRKPIF